MKTEGFRAHVVLVGVIPGVLFSAMRTIPSIVLEYRGIHRTLSELFPSSKGNLNSRNWHQASEAHLGDQSRVYGRVFPSVLTRELIPVLQWMSTGWRKKYMHIL